VTRSAVGLVAAALFVATVFAANYAVNRWHFVPVGFGYRAPAGVFFAGLAFTLRDEVHDRLGARAVLAAVAVGAASSWLISGRLAAASAAAFAASELCDLAVYAPLRDRGYTVAVVASNIVGAVIDSWLFLTIAFGSTAFLAGQVIGKLEMTLLVLPLLAVRARRRAFA
jgi:uncharacterized PurR-regulated membrane protein YhhQ (DUF165 family)